MSKWVLVVDDDTSVLRLVSHILTQHDLRASCVRSGEAALAFVEQSEQLPDLVLLDILMPGMDGFETLARLQKDPRGSELPVIFLTADEDSGSETKALEAGAMDFIKKPIIPEVLITRVRHTIDLTHLQRVLTSQVIEQTAAAVEHRERFDRLSLQLVHTLAGAIDAKDAYTNGHSERVATYAREIALRAGKSESVQENIYLIGLLHDVGKIGIPDTILNKPGKLTDEEYAVIKTHPLQGDKILRNISEFPELAIGARWHHERYDGYGYPDGIAGEQIPEEARIIAVADAYDAMTSSRSYRDPLSQERVRSEIVNGRWSQFDPVFADVMQKRRVIDLPAFLVILAHHPGDLFGVFSHTHGMSVGICVLGVYGVDERRRRLLEQPLGCLLLPFEILQLVRLIILKLVISPIQKYDGEDGGETGEHAGNAGTIPTSHDLHNHDWILGDQ